MDRDMKLTLILMAFICFLAWGSFRSLSDRLRRADQLTDRALVMVEKLEPLLGDVNTKLDKIPDTGSEMEAVWREINRLSNQ